MNNYVYVKHVYGYMHICLYKMIFLEEACIINTLEKIL